MHVPCELLSLIAARTNAHKWAKVVVFIQIVKEALLDVVFSLKG